MTKILIDGQEIELTDIDDGSYVTDVLIFRRTVTSRDDGMLEDALWVDSTRTTTGMIQQGMLSAAADMLAGCSCEDDDDE